jgi:ABC-2 type transport system permease protein
MSLEVIVDQSAMGGRTVVTALDAVVARLVGAVESAHMSAEAYHQRAGFTDSTARQVYFDQAFQTALAGWSDPPLSARVELATGSAGAAKEGLKINGFIQSSAGMMVQFAIFGLINSGMLLVLERKHGALQRLMTTPVRRAEVIAGHILAMFVVVLLQEALLVMLGQFAFGVDYLRQPLGTLLMMAALALWAASLGLLIGAVSRREDQVILLCLVVMFVFSTLGGAWFPLEVTGKTFSSIGHLLPTAWAMDGFQNIVLRGLGFSSTLLPAGLLLAYSLAFFGIAIWRFKFE